MPDSDETRDPENADRRDEQATGDTGGRSRRRVVLTVIGALLALPLLTGTAVAGWLWVTTDVPPPGAVFAPQVSQLRWDDGALLASVGEQNRRSVPLAAVSPAAQHAVLAAEDRRFYESGGISLRGTTRALWANLRSGEVQQGGSTITQQYARNAFLTQERTWTRKAREAVIALKLERTRDKDEILERYLNTVYFGRGAYGIEAAAGTYFRTPAAELTAEQGAVLAALLAAPSSFDPARDPERARERWQYVLRGMVEQGWLDGPVERYEYPEVRPPHEGGNALGGPNGYLVRQALDELEQIGYREDEIGVGGYKVVTTFDRRAQELAARELRETTGEQLPEGVYRALVTVEPGTGRVVASYGGADYVSRPLDAAVEGSAQAGSSFKPFVLAAALDQGISLRTRYDGRSPQRFGDYEVKNYGPGDGQDFGRIDLVEATRSSVNTVYVPLGLDAGTEAVADTAAALGVTSDMSRERTLPSISLGVTAVTPLDMATAYATLAAGGVRAEPYVVEKVIDRDGDVVYEAKPTTTRAIDADVAADVTHALRSVVAGGTGAAAALPDRPAAGKTGTTTDNTAAWFVGYTPRLATAVSLYTERTDMSLTGIAGVASVTGGSLPARTWGAYSAALLAGVEPAPFPEPEFVGSTPSPSPRTVAPPSSRDEPDRTPTRTPRRTPSETTSGSPTPTESASPTPTEAPTGSEGPVEDVTDPVEPTEEPTEEPAEEVVEDEPSQEPTQEPAQEPSQEPTQEPSGGTQTTTSEEPTTTEEVEDEVDEEVDEEPADG